MSPHFVDHGLSDFQGSWQAFVTNGTNAAATVALNRRFDEMSQAAQRAGISYAQFYAAAKAAYGATLNAEYPQYLTIDVADTNVKLPLQT